MRAQRPSSMKRHSNFKDCQSHDPSVTDTVLAHKTVRTKHVQTEHLQTELVETDRFTSRGDANLNNVALNNLSIAGQTSFPENFHTQLYDHFTRTGQAMRVPRIIADSVTSHGMMWAKNNLNVDNLTTDGCIDARGNFNCFGVAHFYGPIKIHGSFEVDQNVTTRVTSSLLAHVTEEVQAPKEIVREKETQLLEVQTFHCKLLEVDQIKAKDSLDVKQVSTQRLFSYTHNVKELVAETLQVGNVVVNESITTSHVDATTGQIGTLHIATLLDAPRINVNVLEVGDMVNARTMKSELIESKKVSAKSLTCDKIQTTQLDVAKQAQIDQAIIKSLSVQSSLSVQGETICHDTTRLQDTLCSGSFQLSDRIESKVGQPIQCRQSIQFHQPTCWSAYQYFIFNTQQSSVAKPFRVDIHDNVSALIIDSDVTNIVSLEIKLPSNPLPGQVLAISTNPSISSVQIRASAPILNSPTTMTMGSYVQFMYIDRTNKWFRIA